MNSTIRTLEQIRRDGLAALDRELGMVDAIRFLQLFDTGHRDYTAERRDLHTGETLDTILGRIQMRHERDQHTADSRAAH